MQQAFSRGQGSFREALLRVAASSSVVGQQSGRAFASANDALSESGAPSQEGQGSRSGWVLLFPAAFAGFLGCWQVRRYRWKVELLDRRKAGTQEEAFELLSLPHQPAEYARVAATGEFQHDKSIYIGPRPRTVMGTAIAGYTLITPLVAPEWNKAVLVNRGWVPADWRTDAGLRALNSPQGQVSVNGLVRSSEPRSGFVPDNDPKLGQWYWIDVPQIAAACGLPPETSLIEVYADSETQEGPPGAKPTSMDVLSFKARQPKSTALYPIPKSTDELLRVGVTPTDHRNYAITWFTLSAATAFLAHRAMRKRVLPKPRHM